VFEINVLLRYALHIFSGDDGDVLRVSIQ